MGERLVAILMLRATGMLSGAVRGLIARGDTVHVITRGRAGVDRLRGQAGDHKGRIHWHRADDTDPQAFQAAVTAAWNDEPFDRVVVWGSDETARDRLFQIIAALAGDRRITAYLIRGSRYHDAPPPRAPDEIDVRTIILGFVIEPSGSRWLTHDEISSGVLAAIEKDRPYAVIGIVEPSERRPGW